MENVRGIVTALLNLGGMLAWTAWLGFYLGRATAKGASWAVTKREGE